MLDVLIATVVVGILGAVAYPMFVPGTQCGHVSSCLSKLKQIGMATLMYVEDANQHLPPASHWIDATYPYSKNGDTYRCPVVQTSNPKAFGYSFNSDLSLIDSLKIAQPAIVALAYDSNHRHRNANDAITSLPKIGRHSSVNNFVFADGHVKAIKQG